MINPLYVFLILYSITWTSICAGFIIVKTYRLKALAIRKWIINKRIEQFKHFPFNFLLKLWIKRRFFAASLFFIFLLIIPASIGFALLGCLFISPLLAAYQGLIAGLLISGYKGKDLIWALSIGLFETGYWVISGTIGIVFTLGFINFQMSAVQSFENIIKPLLSDYWPFLITCFIVNGFGEIAGPIYLNVKGLISLEQLLSGENI